MMGRHTDDYKTVVTTDEAGKENKSVVYTGSYFEISLDQQELTRFKRNCLLLLAAIAMLHVGAGIIGNKGMYQFYIAVPYVIAFFPLVYLVDAAIRMPWEKRPYRRIEIENTFNRLKMPGIVMMVSVGIVIVGDIAFLFLASELPRVELEMLFLAVEIPAFILLLILFRSQKRIQIQTCADPSQA